jgi:hypothetical protein
MSMLPSSDLTWRITIRDLVGLHASPSSGFTSQRHAKSRQTAGRVW